MTVTLGELATLVQGELRGQATLVIEHALPLQVSLPAGCVTLVDKPQALELLRSSNASAVIAPHGTADLELPAIVVADPHAAFETVIKRIRPVRTLVREGIDPRAAIDPSAEIGEGAAIAQSAVIGPGCRIGRNVRLHPGVTIMADCVIGDDCEIYASVVLYPGTRLGDRCTCMQAACWAQTDLDIEP